jgi:hypothetical protein
MDVKQQAVDARVASRALQALTDEVFIAASVTTFSIFFLFFYYIL